MALSKPGLKSELHPEIVAKLEALFSIVPGQGEDWLDKFADAMAEAIANKVIDHFVANAEVITATPNASPGMNTLPGTGTIT